MTYLKAINPCINCITFPICLSMFNQIYKQNTLRFLHNLSDKCSIVDNHLYHYNRGYIDGSRTVELIEHYLNSSKLDLRNIDE